MAKEDDLERELGLLSGRTLDLAETGELPRGKQPGLFRAARAASSDPAKAGRLAALGEALAPRIADAPIFPPIVELAREIETVREPLLTTLEARASSGDAWAVERQAKVMRDSLGSKGLEPLETLLELAADELPTEPSPRLSRTGERELAALVEVRLATPGARRDRTSHAVARGALELLARRAPKEPGLLSLAARTIEAETRRAGSDEPVLALAALAVLERAEPLARFRAAKALEKRIDRKKVQDRLGAAAEQALRELGASPEDQRDLLADDGGLGPDGALPVELDSGERLSYAIDDRGQVALLPGSPSSLRGGVPPEASRLEKTRSEHAHRLARELGSGRSRPLSIFRAVFLGENALLRDLASRLVWLALPAKGAPISFRPAGSSLQDVFGSSLPALDEATKVRLAHPVELDPDELALWQERLREAGKDGGLLVQPFPQLHRLARREQPGALERLVGREAYRDQVAELARARGYRGLPLRGDGPWEIARDFDARGAVLSVVLEPIAAPAPPPAPRRDALRVLDDPDRKHRAPREAAPRLRLAKAELVGAQDPVALAEAASDLHALTDPLACGTESFFAEWQRRKYKDPAAAWREAQEKLALGSEASAFVRASLVSALVPRAKLQGRWVVLPEDTLLELASGHAFSGPLHDFVAPWRIRERVERVSPLSLGWPFPRATDEDTARVVESVAALVVPPSSNEAGADLQNTGTGRGRE